MANERVTENLVRDALRNLGYYSQEYEIAVEEQKSNIEEVRKLLTSASKSGGGGKGAPEFIISSPSSPDFLLVVECKAGSQFHESAGRDRPVEFAVDGALHYARHLSRSFNVIAIAVSGQTAAGAKISSFIWPRGAGSPKPLTNKHGNAITEIVSFDDFVAHGSYNPQVEKNRQDDLMAFSRDLHIFMRNHAKLTESEKPLVVSGTLIALRNKAFANSFADYSPEDLQRQWMHVIKDEIEKADIPNSKKASMSQPYSSIAVHPELGKATSKYPKGVLHELIRMLNEKVWPFVSIYHDFDVVGQFYGEFLKYTGGDKKALGIVLTPRHITDLFARLANVVVSTTSNAGASQIRASKVLDICAGTGGFLISSMQHMLLEATSDAEASYIKKHCLVGVEQQPNMYALAASNMILRGDGKANLYQGSCFDAAITKEIKQHRCDVGMLNPPYSQEDEDLHELVFVKHMLDCLVEQGVGIAIIPLPKVIAPHPAKEELLRYHTLEAVMTMPHELFYPVGRATCIMVFTAHTPHQKSNRKTWFGYWKDDGFVKTKNLGRIDLYGRWPRIRDSWVSAYRNRDEVAGLSVKSTVTAADEWCAEAYMETDYSAITLNQLTVDLKRFLVHSIMAEDEFELMASEQVENEQID